jgi:hypothetical protein
MNSFIFLLLSVILITLNFRIIKSSVTDKFDPKIIQSVDFHKEYMYKEIVLQEFLPFSHYAKLDN